MLIMVMFSVRVQVNVSGFEFLLWQQVAASMM